MPELPTLLAARCAACTAATALPLSLFLLLAQMAAGGQLVLVVLDLRGEVTRGFLKLTTVAYLATALVAALVLLAAPLFAYQRLYQWGTPWVIAGYAGFAAFLLSGVGYALALFRAPDLRASGVKASVRRSPDPTRALAGAGAAAGLLALAALFATLGGSPGGATAILLAFLAAGVVVGAVTTGMLLGHWYLVTPTLTSAPLQETIGALFLALTLQALAFPAALAGLSARPSLATIWRSYGLLSGLWVLSAVAMPLTAVGLSWLTCRLRSFMSTTGLLYLAMASVLAGQIVGAELFLLAAAG